MADTWEGQLQPFADPSSLTIIQFVMVLLIALYSTLTFGPFLAYIAISTRLWGRSGPRADSPRCHSDEMGADACSTVPPSDIQFQVAD